MDSMRWVADRQRPLGPVSAGSTSPRLRTSPSPKDSGCSSGLSSSTSSITRTSTHLDLAVMASYPSADRRTTPARTSEKLDPRAMLRMIRGRFSLPSSCITEPVHDQRRARSRALLWQIADRSELIPVVLPYERRGLPSPVHVHRLCSCSHVLAGSRSSQRATEEFPSGPPAA